MSEGTHEATGVELARLPSGIPIRTTVHTYRGRKSGPTVYVQAAQHGREINGTEVLRRFHDRIDLSALAGTVVTVPVANPLTFDHVSYTSPEILDSVNQNMNRIWPGDETGSLHERMAARLWTYVERADAVVDLHTGSPDMLPHVLFLEDDAESEALANAFGTDLLVGEHANDDPNGEFHRRRFYGKLRVVASRRGIPAITPELAHSKQILDDVVERGVEGLFDVLRHLDALPGTVPERDVRVARNDLGRVRAEASGLFRANQSLRLGQYVDAGSAVGTVYDPTTYEILQEGVTEHAGILYGLEREATVTAGDTLANVATVPT